jgi:ubiquinone/menaquinone biosynthesis C-methylase UbiE
MIDSKLEFWNTRAQFGDKAGTNDLPLKDLEMRVLSEYIRDGQNVLDIGCGNGVTAFHFLDKANIKITGLDFAEKMIEDANRRLKERGTPEVVAGFYVGDVRDLSGTSEIANKQYDVIITERVLINLSSWEEQESALRSIVERLAPNGVYLMCENLEEGLNNINRARTVTGLSEIEMPWHNRYLREKEIRGVDFAELVEYRDFSSIYYFLSRVVNAWIAKASNSEPQYDSSINQLATYLIDLREFESMGLGQTRLWVWRRRAQ